MKLVMELRLPHQQRVIVAMQFEIGIDAEECIAYDTNNDQQSS
jgi:hypothetical protein